MAKKKPTPWEIFELCLKYRNGGNILARGASATGKNQRIYRTLGKPGDNFLVMNMTAQTSKEDAYGHFVPTEKNNLVWMNNAVTHCMEAGIPLVLNEIDKAAVGGEALDILLYVCESLESCMVTLPKGERAVIRAKPGYMVIATMNGQFSDLPENVLTRFPRKIDLGDEVDPHALLAIPEWARGLANNRSADPEVFNLRTIFPFVKAIEDGMDILTACYVYFGEKWAADVNVAILTKRSQTKVDANFAEFKEPKDETPEIKL